MVQIHRRKPSVVVVRARGGVLAVMVVQPRRGSPQPSRSPSRPHLILSPATPSAIKSSH